jgi:hypothetical protein
LRGGVARLATRVPSGLPKSGRLWDGQNP